MIKYKYNAFNQNNKNKNNTYISISRPQHSEINFHDISWTKIQKYNNNKKLYNNSLALPFYTSILPNIFIWYFIPKSEQLFDCMQGRRHAVWENVYRETYTNGSSIHRNQQTESVIFNGVCCFLFHTAKCIKTFLLRIVTLQYKQVQVETKNENY